MEQELDGHGFGIVSPRADAQRGSQVCLSHPQAWPITQALIERGVIGDFRTPDILRFGLAPLYTRTSDIWRAVAVLKLVMRQREWDAPRHYAKGGVT